MCKHTFPHLSPPDFSLSTQSRSLLTFPADKAQKIQDKEIQIKFAFFLIYFTLKFFLKYTDFLHEFPSHSRSRRRRENHQCLTKASKQQIGHAAQNQSL